MICKLCSTFYAVKFDISTLWNWQPIHDIAICDRCWQQVRPIDELSCPDCGRQQTKVEQCQDCQQWLLMPTYKVVNKACYQYNDVMKKFMVQYKYRYDFELRHIFQNNFTMFLKATEPAIYVAIPNKHPERKFNQVTNLVKNNTIKFLPILKLKFESIGQAQAHRNRYERMTSHLPFEVDQDLIGYIKDKRVVLVDDIYTTGATIHQAATLLAKFGPKEIIARTLCR